MLSINGTTTSVLNGSINQVLVFSLTEGIPAVTESDVIPSFVRYDGNSSLPFSFNYSLTEFLISSVDINQHEGNYTLLASNNVGSSEDTLYLDVQSELFQSCHHLIPFTSRSQSR